MTQSDPVWGTSGAPRALWPSRCATALAIGIACGLALATVGLFAVAGCASGNPNGDPVPPPPAVEGPEFLHGTIGSYTRPRGFEPVPVGGYGLVVNLPGSGSSDVPSFLRQSMERQMAQRGVGSTRYGMSYVSPRRMLQSNDTAVVAVRGVIPPGAPRGSRFDLLVTALPGTQTTNLQGGQLWSVDLSSAGLSEAMMMERPLARGQGSLIVDPIADDKPAEQQIELKRQAVILGGGVVSQDRPLHLVLNRPDWTRSRQIADRINERFPREPDAGRDTAVAQSDALIEINIPRRFESRPGELLRLIEHTYLQRTPGFEQQQARRLGQIVEQSPNTAENVSLTWQVLGRPALPQIAQYYQHSDRRVQGAALRAGARLGDHNAVDSIVQWAQSEDWRHRVEATMLMAYISNNGRIRQTLRQLLDDDDRRVRIAAYETLAATRSPLVRKIPFGQGAEAKFRLDLVPAEEPLVYITQVGIPRVVIFNPNATFKSDHLAQLWDNRLMLRRQEGQPLEVFYQPYRRGQEHRNPEHHHVAPTVAHLVALLGHRPTMDEPEDGFDLSYSQVSHVLYNLHRMDALDADIEVRMSDLASVIADLSHRRAGRHPETGPDPTLRPVAAHGQQSSDETPGGAAAAAEAFEDDDLPMPMQPRGMDDDDQAPEGAGDDMLDMLDLPQHTAPTRVDTPDQPQPGHGGQRHGAEGEGAPAPTSPEQPGQSPVDAPHELPQPMPPGQQPSPDGAGMPQDGAIHPTPQQQHPHQPAAPGQGPSQPQPAPPTQQPPQQPAEPAPQPPQEQPPQQDAPEPAPAGEEDDLPMPIPAE